jgi:hypothetical protein
VQVTSGEKLSFVMARVGFPAGVCGGTTCTAGMVGQACMANSQCDFFAGIDDSSAVTYAGGNETLNGVSVGADLDFKTFVR